MISPSLRNHSWLGRLKRSRLARTRLVFLVVAAISAIALIGPVGRTTRSSPQVVNEIKASSTFADDSSLNSQGNVSVHDYPLSTIRGHADTEQKTKLVTLASCGFVNPPIDPSPMDCYTKLVADNTNDPSDVGTRVPVILIHGLHGNRVGNTDDPQTSTNDIYFANLISYMSSRPNFQGGGQFKLYRFHYRSDYQSVWQIARSLRNRIDDLVKQNPQLEPKKFVLIAHSMGGLVARSSMNEHDTDFCSTYRCPRP